MKLVNRIHRFLALFVGLAMLVPLFSGSFTTSDMTFKRKQTTENKMNTKNEMEITMIRVTQSIRERSKSWIKQFKISKGAKLMDSLNHRENGSKLIDLQDGASDMAVPFQGHQNQNN